jgi:hypothetical protein
MGNFIDSFDLVVRINELGISKEYFADYGSRTDVAFLTLSEQSLKVYKKMLEKVNISDLKIVVQNEIESIDVDTASQLKLVQSISEIFNSQWEDEIFNHII